MQLTEEPEHQPDPVRPRSTIRLPVRIVIAEQSVRKTSSQALNLRLEASDAYMK